MQFGGAYRGQKETKIHCVHCNGSSVWRHSEAEAVTAWNRRPTPSALPVQALDTEKMVDAVIEAAMDVYIHRSSSPDGQRAQTDLNIARASIIAEFSRLAAPTPSNGVTGPMESINMKARDFLYELTSTLRGWMEADEFAMSRTSGLLAKVGAYLTETAPEALATLRTSPKPQGSPAQPQDPMRDMLTQLCKANGVEVPARPKPIREAMARICCDIFNKAKGETAEADDWLLFAGEADKILEIISKSAHEPAPGQGEA